MLHRVELRLSINGWRILLLSEHFPWEVAHFMIKFILRLLLLLLLHHTLKQGLLALATWLSLTLVSTKTVSAKRIVLTKLLPLEIKTEVTRRILLTRYTVILLFISIIVTVFHHKKLLLSLSIICTSSRSLIYRFLLLLLLGEERRLMLRLTLLLLDQRTRDLSQIHQSSRLICLIS